MIKKDEAFLLLRKWRDERTPLRVTCRVRGFAFDVDCFVATISEEGWVTLRFEDKRGSCDVWLGPMFGFEYRDPAELPVEEKIAEGLVHGAVLAALTPEGETLFFVELEKPS